MMDILSELQGYYSMARTINMDERKMRFQKLSFEAQEFAFDFESLINQNLGLNNIIEKLGKKVGFKKIIKSRHQGSFCPTLQGHDMDLTSPVISLYVDLSN